MSSGFSQEQHHAHRREQRGAQRLSNRPRMSHPLRERLNTAEGSLESPEVHRLYTTADGMFGGHVPVLKYGQQTRPSHRRKAHPQDRQQVRSAAESVLQGHRRGYDVPPAIPTPHHGDGIAVTRQPIKAPGEKARLTRQDSLASYWLSCGSSLSSLTTQHYRQPEFHFDWKNNNRSQRTLSSAMGSIPPDHYMLEPMLSSSEGNSDPSRSSRRKPPAAAAAIASRGDDDDDANMVTDSDNSQPSSGPPAAAAAKASPASFPTETTTPRNAPLPQVSSAPRRVHMAPRMVDVGGGLLLQLRGAEETMRAIRNDFYTPCSCLSCQQVLFCILDADYLICPTCRVVSPIATSGDVATTTVGGGGVGLGFTMDQLAHYQKEISRQMRR